MTTSDDDLARRLRDAVRRVKRIMRYRGSMETDDFVDELVARWVARGHWEAMREAHAGYLAVAIRRRILDDIAARKRRPATDARELDALHGVALPAEEDLARLVDVHLMRAWVDGELARLERGEVEALPLHPSDPLACARVLRATLVGGRSQREAASELGCGLATINAHHQIGVAYLALRAHAAGWRDEPGPAGEAAS